MEIGTRKAKSVLKDRLMPPVHGQRQEKLTKIPSEATINPYRISLSPSMSSTQTVHMRYSTNPIEYSHMPIPSPTRNPHVHTTATEKYYLQIISTMKKEMTSLLQIIKAKDKEIEQLMDAKQELKAVNTQLRTMISEKAGNGKVRRKEYTLSRSFDVAEKRREKRRNEVE
jgi:hypothetical protein